MFLVEKESPARKSSSQPGGKEEQRPANSYRAVVDLRNLNKACFGDNFELSNLNHVLDTNGSDKYFSVFNLSSLFHQICYTEDSKRYTAFVYKNRQYWFARMIMGFKGSSSLFSRMMCKL